MGETVDPIEIRTYSPGDKSISSSDLNTFARFSRTQSSSREGYTHEEGLVTGNTENINTSPIRITALGGALPKYSLIGILSGGAASQPILVNATNINHSGDASPLTLYTTGSNSITSGKNGYAYPLVPGERYFCRVSGDIPKVGHPCGVVPGGSTLSSEFSGLVCISELKTRYGTSGVWVSMPQAGNLVAYVEEDLEPFDQDTKTLGKGTAKVHIRNGGSEALEVQTNPGVATGDFEIPVRNVIPALVPKDTLVLLHPYAGVGMLAIPASGVFAFHAWVETSIAAGMPQVEDGTGATAGGTPNNATLQRYNGTFFEHILDDGGAEIKISLKNHCGVVIDALQRIEGNWVNGYPFAVVVCCPP